MANRRRPVGKIKDMQIWKLRYPLYVQIDCGLGFKTYLKNLENIHAVIPS
jgi:hypothetical protein